MAAVLRLPAYPLCAPATASIFADETARKLNVLMCAACRNPRASTVRLRPALNARRPQTQCLHEDWIAALNVGAAERRIDVGISMGRNVLRAAVETGCAAAEQQDYGATPTWGIFAIFMAQDAAEDVIGKADSQRGVQVGVWPAPIGEPLRL